MATGEEPEPVDRAEEFMDAEEPIEDAQEPSEEELRAAYEAQVKRLRVEHVVLENVVTLANLGMRRTGLSPGTEDERDPAQVRMAIESIRVLMPMIEEAAPQQVGAIRDALSQLQLAFVRIGGSASAPGGGAPPAGPSGGTPSGGPEGGAPPAGPEPTPEAKPDEPGPAQRSGRLWVPGQ
jgi:hypothetical protein